MKRFLLVLFILAMSLLAKAQNKLPPKWVHQQVLVGEKCDFILIHSEGESSIRNARMASLTDLRDKIAHTDVVSVNQTMTGKSQDVYSSDGTGISFSSKQEDESWIEINIEGLPTAIESRRIDEYSRRKANGVDYYALIAVPEPGSKVDLSRLAPSSSYASDPATWGLSLIPGAAQMHKGAYAKGGVIMGSSVALAGGLIALESMRANHLAKIDQTHSADVKKAYNDRASACATGRNICIGALAALYIYNIVDAIIAPGARRIIVTPSVTPDGQYGMGVSYNF